MAWFGDGVLLGTGSLRMPAGDGTVMLRTSEGDVIAELGAGRVEGEGRTYVTNPFLVERRESLHKSSFQVMGLS